MNGKGFACDSDEEAVIFREQGLVAGASIRQPLSYVIGHWYCPLRLYRRLTFLVDPTVSLIIPTYNRAKTLHTALRSARAQTYPSVEIIVLDDASTDASPAQVEALADASVRYVRNAANRGPNANWRAGMAGQSHLIYSGEYLQEIV